MHLAGAANVVSDSGSRDSTFASRWNADPFREAVLKASVMDRISSEFGPFDCDLFADRLGVTAQAPHWFHPENTAFEAQVLGNKVWAHPPRAVAGHAFSFLAKALAEGKCSAVF